LEQQNDVLWHNQILAAVKASVVYLKNVKTIGVSLGKLLQESLITLGIDMGELPEESLSRCWFNSAIEPKGLEQPLPLSNRFNSTGSNQASQQGLQAKATFIGRKITNWAFILENLSMILT
jgi:hypothetical protein